MPTLDIVRAELAPGGAARAAINLGNIVLAQRAGDTGELTGVSTAIAREVAARLGVPLHIEAFHTAAQAFEALKYGRCDFGFLAIDPERAETLAYTAGYVRIEGTYLVSDTSGFERVADLDRDDVRIAAGRNTAYDLFLSRTLRHAALVHAPTSLGAIDLFLEGKADACAGVRQTLVRTASQIQGLRVLDDAYQTIDQAVALVHGRPAALEWLTRLIETLQTSGFIAEQLALSGQGDAGLVQKP
ncbi:transporter substrate-binding domain-containing protein [uncultured Brevundimonas sp.]|uniref:transporter substrate-binding domain-containing protein n=1 Tax=uncultured Brevundimonas sp. TaxID=213418 RepID=UPI0026010AD1|nr:transporter substrate-binding domain-containing protein [uncultured Brevundimonas sp.]